MGKRKYNAKARQVIKTSIDNTKTDEIHLDFGSNEYSNSDASNLLALPSKKRNTKVITEKKEKTRFLSKAHRKKLEKILDKKKKKENRSALLESLSQVQATPEEVKQMTGISTVQTLGLRKINNLDLLKSKASKEVEKDNGNIKKKLNSIRGAYKRKHLLKLGLLDQNKKPKHDPNVVGLDESSLYGSSSDSDGSVDENESGDVIDVEDNVTQNGPELESEQITDNKNKDIENTKANDTKSLSNESETLKNSVTKENIPKEKENVAKVKEESTDKTAKPVVPPKHVLVNRDPKVQVARLKLPILGEEQKIMELISENDILIVSGETGSGKTTQIPQFLYEAGYAERRMIAVTEPRRVAAVAMAARVAHELHLTDEVSYLMRFEGNVTKDTKIKFMTDGVLLKESKNDCLMSNYSVVVIDEAHERSVYTDILLGVLSRAVPLRRKRGVPLKLIIMSATLRVEDFLENTRLFKVPPPVINIESRQFPVTIHFNKHTYSDYLKEAYRKTVKIHTRLPEGGILIFVTGQQEIHYLVRKLKAAFPYRKDVDYSKIIQKNKPNVDAALDSEPEDIESDDDEVEKEMKRAKKARRKAKKKAKSLPKIDLADYDMPDDDAQADLVDDDSDGHLSDSDTEADTLLPAIRACRQPLWVLPLYAMLGTAAQGRVFEPPPPGARLAVVSTDVAETSLTIPNIKYVVDTGKKKMRVYDPVSGASSWRVVWASGAGAGQRAGRAGRCGAGHAYRLYSSAVLQHDMPRHHPPDLARRPPDDLVLLMKTMGIDKVVNFPFPTAPDRMNLRLAEKRLEVLGLLEKHQYKDKNKKICEDEIMKVTPLGHAVSAFPILPRYGKMLALSHQQNLLPYVIALVSALTVPEVMSSKPDGWPAAGHLLLLGDPGVLLRAVGASDHARGKGEEELFCAKHGLRLNAVREIRKLRKQLTNEINLRVEGAAAEVVPDMPPPSDNQARLIRQLLLCGLGDQVARKIGIGEVKEGQDKRKFKYAYHCAELDEPVHLHSDSILRKTIPEWVVFQELYETGAEERRKMVMRNVTAVEPEWLPLYVPNLCNLGDPLTEPEPRYEEKTGTVKCHFKGTFGKSCWELPTVEVDFPEKIEKYRWFGRFLLEGAVFPKLRQYRSCLLSPPSTMVKSWAKLQPRTEALLNVLISRRAGTKDQLKRLWGEQPKFLLDAYLKWLPVSAHNEAILYWPPI